MVLRNEFLNVSSELYIKRDVRCKESPRDEDEEEYNLSSIARSCSIPVVSEESVDTAVLFFQFLHLINMASFITYAVVLVFFPGALFFNHTVQDECWRDDHQHVKEVNNDHDSAVDGNAPNWHDWVPGVPENRHCGSCARHEGAAQGSSQYKRHSPFHFVFKDVVSNLRSLVPCIEVDQHIVNIHSYDDEDC